MHSFQAAFKISLTACATTPKIPSRIAELLIDFQSDFNPDSPLSGSPFCV